MRKIITVILLSCSVIIVAQTKPLDTTFYSNGTLKTVKYKRDSRYTGQDVLRYFKKSRNPLDQNQPIVDTMFENDYANEKDWSHYDGTTRVFLHNSSNVYQVKKTKYGYKKDSAYYKINGGYHFLFKDLGDLDVGIAYNRDTAITWLYISIYDSLKGGYGSKEDFYDTRYNSKTGARFGKDRNEFQCGEHGTLQLFFEENNLIHKFHFWPKDETKPTTYYELYGNFFCKKYGHYLNQLPIGEYYEYHPNGNISIVGKYEILKNGEKNDYGKDGLWQYFTEEGSLIKKEWYEKGKLIKKEKTSLGNESLLER